LQLQRHLAALVFERNLQDVRTFAPLQSPKFSKNKGNIVVNVLASVCQHLQTTSFRIIKRPAK